MRLVELFASSVAAWRCCASIARSSSICASKIFTRWSASERAANNNACWSLKRALNEEISLAPASASTDFARRCSSNMRWTSLALASSARRRCSSSAWALLRATWALSIWFASCSSKSATIACCLFTSATCDSAESSRVVASAFALLSCTSKPSICCRWWVICSSNSFARATACCRSAFVSVLDERNRDNSKVNSICLEWHSETRASLPTLAFVAASSIAPACCFTEATFASNSVMASDDLSISASRTLSCSCRGSTMSCKCCLASSLAFLIAAAASSFCFANSCSNSAMRSDEPEASASASACRCLNLLSKSAAFSSLTLRAMEASAIEASNFASISPWACSTAAFSTSRAWISSAAFLVT
mmetsp:Transcript_18361/g.50451  ORF Transcript_18361/g.50451 Transcript_18361/m.50451 type:complete len:362 (-) Transcript_18361:1043-2128(-)